MSTPKVSVVIPAYNAGKWIEEAIQSVFVQNFDDFELIVVDDGSTDTTPNLLQPFVKTGRLRYFHQSNAGVSAARNRGIAKARGAYIAFLDADDLFLADKLSKQVALLEAKPELGFVHSHFRKFDEMGNDLGLRDMSQFSGLVYPDILQEWSALIALPSILVPKKVFEQVGVFDEGIHWGEDIDLYFRIARHYELDLVPEALCLVRVHAASASASKIGAAESFHRVLEKALTADSELNDSFKNTAFSKLYINKAQNLLGEATGEELRTARVYARKALQYAPSNISAWIALISSWLPRSMRHLLAAGVRRMRYRRDSAKQL